MGDTTTDEKQTSAAKKTPGKTNAPISMSAGDHTAFVDLLFQQTAQSARTAAALSDPKELMHASGQTVARAVAALGAYTIPDAGTTPTQLFRSVDGAFMGIYDLFYVLQDQKDPAASSFAPVLKGVMVDINDRFAPVGWKVPKSDAEGHVRAKVADKAGATSLTSSEKGRLGRMHIRAARQYLVGAWEDISDGKLGAAAIAAHNLRDGMSILIDPHLAGEIDATADELAATEQVFDRLIISVEQTNAGKLGDLRELAQQLDALLRLVGRDGHWIARIHATSPPTTASPAGPQGVATQQPGATQGAAPGTTGAMSNDVDRAAPRAEPGMHRLGETRSWTKKVHIMDTNYVDEYLGYIELYMEAYKTPSGQVYVQRAKATKHLEGRAGEYLSMGADVVANSIELKGQRFCDVYFDIQIGGPNKTETTAISAGFKASAKRGDEGAEASAGVVFSSAVSSQGTRTLRRVFRISSLGKPVQVIQYENDNPYRPKVVETGMEENERAELHQDFEDFELDDDDVGDTVTSFYANWVLHSYSD
jgi:hypothetical protein